MTAETFKIKSKLAALSTSFDDLEAQLEPLFSQSFPETIIALEPLQQAKLQTLVPYLVYDLIFS
jgi:exosome complex protein LRP1